MAKVFLSLGSNVGNRAAALQMAVACLSRFGQVTAASSVIETAPMYVRQQPSFLNMAVALETALAPEQLLVALQGLEADMGRQRLVDKGPRLIDIDMIYYDNRVMTTPWLTLPHPLRAERGFVLEPLAAIAPDWIDPVLGCTVQELWTALCQADAMPAKAA